MKSSTRVLGMALLLAVLLAVFPIGAGARGISNITGTQPEQRHGFDLGRPSAAESVVPGATRSGGSSSRKSASARSTAKKPSVHKKYASGKEPKRGSKGGEAVQADNGTTVILSRTESPRHVLISKITPADSTTAAKDPMQNDKTRRVADILMTGIAGFSIVAILIYVFTYRRNK